MNAEGQFGSRINGGKDHAQARYIETKLSKISNYVYNKIDFNVIRFNYEETQKIEPQFLPPVSLLTLFNNIQGIATGYSTTIPSLNVIEVSELLLDELE